MGSPFSRMAYKEKLERVLYWQLRQLRPHGIYDVDVSSRFNSIEIESDIGPVEDVKKLLTTVLKATGFPNAVVGDRYAYRSKEIGFWRTKYDDHLSLNLNVGHNRRPPMMDDSEMGIMDSDESIEIFDE